MHTDLLLAAIFGSQVGRLQVVCCILSDVGFVVGGGDNSTAAALQYQQTLSSDERQNQLCYAQHKRAA